MQANVGHRLEWGQLRHGGRWVDKGFHFFFIFSCIYSGKAG